MFINFKTEFFCFSSKLETSPVLFRGLQIWFLVLKLDMVNTRMSSQVLTGCMNKLIKCCLWLSSRWCHIWLYTMRAYNGFYFDMIRHNFQFLTPAQNRLPCSPLREYVRSYTTNWDDSFLNVTGLVLRLSRFSRLVQRAQAFKSACESLARALIKIRTFEVHQLLFRITGIRTILFF